jgi:hypothetical protein
MIPDKNNPEGLSTSTTSTITFDKENDYSSFIMENVEMDTINEKELSREKTKYTFDENTLTFNEEKIEE